MEIDKSNNPLITVIIPVYNNESYLEECIRSVVLQKLEGWECILINDGSTDKSLKYCDMWAEKDVRVRVYNQKNQGVSAARNKGLSLAKGEFVVFIDSDDRVDREYLSDLISGFQKHSDVGLVVSGLARQYDDGHLVYEQPVEEKSIQLREKDADVFVNNINSFYGPTSKLYRMDVIRENSIRFPVDFSLGEDLIFNFKYLKCISKILLLPVTHYFYNIQQSGSLMTTYRDNRFDLDIYLWNLQYKFLIEKGMWCDSAQRYMSLQLWGITYNGIFNKKKPTLQYIRGIMKRVNEDVLKINMNAFHTTGWIKKSIIHKQALLLYLVRKMG